MAAEAIVGEPILAEPALPEPLPHHESVAAPAVAEQPAPVRHQPHERREHRRGGRGERRDRPAEAESDAPVLAFGDHMPDFLKRPVKLPPLGKEPEAA
jgi:hypothetical protein